MAISIDRVYRSVLEIANKEGGSGFYTREQFNLYAQQAQIEIFEGYFTEAYAQEQAPMSDGDYSDIRRNTEEKITFFDNQTNISVASGFISYPNNFYRLGVVTAGGILIDEVSHKKLPFIRRSPLTAPSTTSPVYTRHEGGITVYPDTITTVSMTYVRVPALPSWAGTYSDDGSVVALPSGMRTTTPGTTTYYQDFELHDSEEPELVNKILFYGSLNSRSLEVLQGAQAKDQQITQQE